MDDQEKLLQAKVLVLTRLKEVDLLFNSKMIDAEDALLLRIMAALELWSFETKFIISYDNIRNECIKKGTPKSSDFFTHAWEQDTKGSF